MSAQEKDLQVIPGGALPTLNVSNEQKLAAIRDTVAKGATEAEFTMLMHLANTYQLDPFLKEIWFIKYGNQPTIMVSRDGLRNYAIRQDDFEGMMSQEVRQGDLFKFNPITGQIQHEIGDGSGPITKCYCIIKRTNKPDHIEIIDFMEYYNALSPKNAVWKSHPSAMGKKTVEVLALKKCYTITGLYAPEEMGLQPVEANVYDISYTESKPSEPKPVHNHPSRETWLEAINVLNAYAESVGLTGDELRNIGGRVTGKANPKQWSLEDIQTVRQHIEETANKSQEDVPAAQSTFTLPSDDELPF